jgi:spore maturation protein CgeB
MRVHLISPAFHGYWQAMAASLTARGHAVTTHLYDVNPSWSAKAWHHARHELPQRLGVGRKRRLARDQTAATIRSLDSSRPEAVVIVKGDTLTGDFWDELDRRGLPRILWLYDEVRRTLYTHATLARVGPVATYSRADHDAFEAAGLNSRHLPLAYDHRLLPHPPGRSNSEVVFVGARYPKREELLVNLAAAGVAVRAYGRDWSAHPFDKLRTWDLSRPPVPSGRDLARDRAYATMASALATLNIHGDQDGFTMRTFEACGVGGLQLIDRADVTGHYEPGEEVLVFSSGEELIELARRAATDTSWAARIAAQGRKRTLAEHTFDHRMATLEAAWATA